MPRSKSSVKSNSGREVQLIGIPVVEEISPGDSIAEKILHSMRKRRLRFHDGDILAVKHKIVSKAEGQMIDLATIQPSKDSIAWATKFNLDARVVQLALRESRSIIRQKNGALITETHHGFLCANSGIDVSNVDGGRHAVLLPKDPDRSAQKIRREIKKRTGFLLAVIVTDSFGRPWREGLVDFAIGIAGIKPLRDDRGNRDPHGYQLHASVEAVADELAAAAGLVCGKLNRTPACIIRGYAYDSGTGRARDLLRPASRDLFR